MNERGFIRRHGFWPLALLWLPVGVVATAAIRFEQEAGPSAEPGMWVAMVLMAAPSLIIVAPCGLPLALGCRRLWRLGYRRSAWVASIGTGVVTVMASLVAGLFGPLLILIYVVVLSLPVWIAWWFLVRRG